MNKVTTTEDGVHSIISEKFGTSYHSLQGALIETDTVYINMGLKYLVEKGLQNISIFEMGFGTGLNAIRTYDKALDQNLKINYTTIEAYPLITEEYTNLNFFEFLGHDLEKQFIKMHESESQAKITFHESFHFTKIIDKIENYQTQQKFDLIYYDAFGPETQAYLWEEPMMKKMRDMLSSNGILVTYCAKGTFKRVLKSLNFHIDSLPGSGRKREITRAKISN